MSVFVVRAFVQMRQMLSTQGDLAAKLADLEKKLTTRLNTHETAIVDVLRQLLLLLNPAPEPDPPRKRIGFQVQEAPGKYSIKRRRK